MALWYSCNKSGIRCLKTLRVLIVRVGNKYSWFWPRVSIWCNSLLNVNIVPKYSGSYLFTNLYHNFIHWALNISLTFNISSSLNNGSVWALYLLFVIMQRARFCSLNIVFHSKPQHVIPNYRWDKIKKSYMSFMAENGRYFFSTFIIPNVREILLAIFAEWELQFINLFIVKPRKLKHGTCSIIFIIDHQVGNIFICYHPLVVVKNHEFSIFNNKR